MASLNSRRTLYGLAVVLIPIGFGVKEMFNLHYWLDPTLILALVIFLLWPARPLPLVSVAIVAFAVFAAYIGTIYLPPLYSDLVSLYWILKEPVRLLLCMMLFWVSVRFFVKDLQFAIRWLVVSVLAQLLLAAYLLVAVLGMVPVPRFLDRFVAMHQAAQWITVATLFVPRACGTFFEAPPFGLFMFCALVLLALAYFRDGLKTRLVLWGMVGALVGVLGSLSEQTLLGALPLLAGLVLSSKRGRVSVRVAFAAVLLAVIPFASSELMVRVQQVEAEQVGLGRVGAVQVGSGYERIFHARFAMEVLSENPWHWLTGMGPGRYGEYVEQVGPFSNTTTPQVTPVSWLFGYGLPGTALILAFLVIIGKNAIKRYGVLLGGGALLGILVANLFQAGWKSEPFFLALAYLYASASFKRTRHRPPERQRGASRKTLELVRPFRR